MCHLENYRENGVKVKIVRKLLAKGRAIDILYHPQLTDYSCEQDATLSHEYL